MECGVANKEIISHLSSEFIADVKEDGTRAEVIFQREKGVKVYSKRNLEITYRYPELLTNLITDCDSLILDGELIMRNKQGNSDFALLQSTGRNLLQQRLLINLQAKRFPIIFVVFDILQRNGEDLRNLPLWKRREILSNSFVQNKYYELIKSSTDIEGLFKETLSKGKEGIIIKNINSRYEERRSEKWLKIKHTKERDILFTDYETHPKGLTLKNDEGIRVACNGYQSQAVKEKLDREHRILITINYLEETRNGMYRQPVFAKIVE